MTGVFYTKTFEGNTIVSMVKKVKIFGITINKTNFEGSGKCYGELMRNGMS